MLIGLLLAPFAAFPAGPAWPYLILSAGIHLVYVVLLMTSFRLGDFGQTYPIARGTAPLVVTVLAAVFAHEVPDRWAAAGIALSCAGLTGVAVWGMRGRRPDWVAIGAALATGLSIALYTVRAGVVGADQGGPGPDRGAARVVGCPGSPRPVCSSWASG